MLRRILIFLALVLMLPLAAPAQDTAAIRGALVEIGHLGDDDYRRMSTAARTVAEQRYSLDVILPRIVELHRRLAGVSV